ncbi:MAG: hypothetical protein JRF63_08930, partial [Deltaproteobacteria bacterium]|nr:hypothetical protein [Deltaproteobacteria bacterium]
GDESDQQITLSAVQMTAGVDYYIAFATDGTTWEMLDPQITITEIVAPNCPMANNYTSPLPASPHPYANNETCTGTAQTISPPGSPTEMCITFDSASYFESPSFDNFYIYDGSCTTGTLLHTFSYGIDDWIGLVGNTLELNGLTNGGDVCLCYITDGSITYYGYEVTSVSYE